MIDVILMKNSEEVKRYKVREASMIDGFRILVDDCRYNKKNGAVIDDDGKSDRVFATQERAMEYIFSTTDKYMTVGYIDSYVVKRG